MSRAVIEGLSYTILDVHIFEDRKIRKLRRLCDASAPLVYIGLLCTIGKERYYIDWNEDAVLDLADMLLMEEDYIEKAVAACIDAGLFSKEMYDTYHILTSHGIQKQYNFVKASAGSKVRVKKYSLLDNLGGKDEKEADSENKLGGKDEKEVFSGINSQEMPQRKEKKSKEENSSFFPKEEKEEKVFICSEFFFRGYSDIEQEYELFIAFNNKPGSKGWDNYSRKEKESALKLWKQKPERPSKHPKAFLQMWKQFYDMLCRVRAPDDVRWAALDERISLVLADPFKSEAMLTVPDLIHYYIEEGIVGDGIHVMDLAKPILWPYITSLGCNKLNYTHCSP